MKVILVLAVFASFILFLPSTDAMDCWKWITCQTNDYRAQTESKKVQCMGECGWWQCSINRVLYSGHGCKTDDHICLRREQSDVSNLRSGACDPNGDISNEIDETDIDALKMAGVILLGIVVIILIICFISCCCC